MNQTRTNTGYANQMTNNGELVVPYTGRYTQPKIVNIIKATSVMGLKLGLLSSIPAILMGAQYIKTISFDLILTLGLAILIFVIRPMIRENKIKMVASVNNFINRTGLIVLTTLMYSSLVRVSIFVVGTVILEYAKDPSMLTVVNTLRVMMDLASFANMNTLVATILSIATIALVVFPQNVSVVANHKMVVDQYRASNATQFRTVDSIPQYKQGLSSYYTLNTYAPTTEPVVNRKPKKTKAKDIKNVTLKESANNQVTTQNDSLDDKRVNRTRR